MKIKVKKKINVLVLTWLSLHIAVTQGVTLKSSNSTPTPQRQNNKHSDNTALHEASLLISEIFFDPTSQGQGYIELYGRGKMTLTNYSIVIYGGPHLKDVSVINLINQSAHSDGAFVIGGPDTQNVDLITNTSILQGNMTILALYKNLDKRFTNSSTYIKTGLLDYVIYGTDNVKAYETELKDFAPESPVLFKDRDEVWYSNGSFSKCYSSSSRDVRGFTITRQTPGRKNECPKVKPVINEVSISKTDDGCFVEVYTPMKRKILLNSFIIVTFMQNGTRYNMYDLWNHVTNDEGFFLLSGKGDKHSTMKINCSQSFSGAVSAVVIYQVTGNLTDFLLKLSTDFHLQDVLLFNTSNTEPKGNVSDLMSKLNQSSSYYIKNLKELQAGSVTISRCNGNFTQSVPTPGMSNICKNSSKTTLQPKSTPKPTTQPTPEPTTKTTPSTTLKPTTQPTPKLTKSTSTPTTQPTPKPTKSTTTSTLKPTTQPSPKLKTNTTPKPTTTAQTVSSKIPTTRPHTSISVFINEINFAPNGQIRFVELNATGVYHGFQPEEYSIVIIDGTSGKKLNFITTDKGAKMNNGLFIMNNKSTAVKNFPSKSFAVALYHKQMNESDSIGDKSLVDAVIIKIDNTKMNRKVKDMMHSKASVHFDKQYVQKKYSVSRCSYKRRLDSGEFSWTKSTPNTKNAKCHERTHPNPQTDKNNDDNIKVTVAVVVSCLALFLIIVGIVVIYMKKKQKAVLQFHLARLDDYDDELITNMESVDQDDLLIGNEPTFSNNLYNKMQS